MIELTESQRQKLGTAEQPPIFVDPHTGERYRLIREEIYEGVRGILRPFGRSWDGDADDDLIKKPS